MSKSLDFNENIDRLRRRDEAAVIWLIQRYEPEIRRLIHNRLLGTNLKRTMDPVDICQSTFFKFLQQLSAGNVRIRTSEELSKLLFTIAKNQLRDELRKTNTKRRGQGMNFVKEQSLLSLIEDPSINPSQIAANRDCWENVKKQLTAGEQHLVEQRALGHDWKTLADLFQSTPAALRRRLVRLRKRLAHQVCDCVGK